jgi:peptide/nickel transport system ATP-binding protein
MSALIEAAGLTKRFAQGAGSSAAVNDVTFAVERGETLAIVGESGCGKTTLARMLLRLIQPDRGRVLFEGRDLFVLGGSELRSVRRGMQMIFQDPFASLNPKMRAGEIVAEPLLIHEPGISKRDAMNRAGAMLVRAGLGTEVMRRYPHEFSGGQRQRLGIARALVLRPSLIVADEPVSALDVSVGAQILLLLRELQQEFALTYIFISHSLPVVAQLATRIAVMRGGQFLELGPADQILHTPSNPYTKELLATVPALPAA